MSDFLLVWAPTILVAVYLFLFGAAIGSLLNVCVYRMPLEKSIIWPGSRCGSCLSRIPLFYNIPILSYLILRGRCRSCKQRFSIEYFFVELFVAVAFVAIFYVEVYSNIHGIPEFRDAPDQLRYRLFRINNAPMLIFFLQRAILFSLLLTAALTDARHKLIPLPITMTGTIVGIMFATACPWPWPMQSIAAAMPRLQFPTTSWWMANPGDGPKMGLYPWPIWGPLPDWLPPGSWQLGLATGVGGALAGTLMVRGIKALFEKGFGREALGLGDADLMMMVGAFLGWQLVVISFLVGAVVTLAMFLGVTIIRGNRELPFGPGLAIGTIITMLLWHRIGPILQVVLFNGWLILIFVAICSVATLFLAFLMRRPADEPPPSGIS